MATKKNGATKIRGVMGVRFSDEERGEIEAAAERAGVTPSTYVRILALRAVRAGAKKL